MNRQRASRLESPNTEFPITESQNTASLNIDSLRSIEIVDVINDQDAGVAGSIARERVSIAKAIDLITHSLRQGGRLVYMGAGTSGRLGVLDAAECPPTFNTPPQWVVGLIAGGHDALTQAIEGAEDHPELGHSDLRKIRLSEKDTVVGIATSGRTPYVIGGLQYARSVGATTIGFSCNDGCLLREHSDVMITPIVGPEVLTGSTRMKAGTATKMVLNMLTTGTMIRLGKTYGNLMVDLRATNTKLEKRSLRLVCHFTQLNSTSGQVLLDQADGELKTAIVMHHHDLAAQHARRLLEQHAGHLRSVLDLDISETS